MLNLCPLKWHQTKKYLKRVKFRSKKRKSDIGARGGAESFTLKTEVFLLKIFILLGIKWYPGNLDRSRYSYGKARILNVKP